MDFETYYIPVNYTDAGKLFGLFEIRKRNRVGCPGPAGPGSLHRAAAFYDHMEDHCDAVPAGADRGICADWPEERQLDPLFENLVDLASAAPVLTYRGEVNAHEFEKRYLRWFRHGNQ